MPVKTKASSEYQQEFPWHDSYRSASYKPSPEIASEAAGVPSTKALPVQEPPLQRKKKPVQLIGSHGFEQVKGAASMDDYFLIGNQKKFADSIKYRNRSKLQNQNVSKSQEKGEPKSSEPVHKPPPPPPKVTVDTGASPPVRPNRKVDKAVETSGQENGMNGEETVPTPKAPRREKRPPPPASKVHSHETKKIPVAEDKQRDSKGYTSVEQGKQQRESFAKNLSKSQGLAEIKHRLKDKKEVTHQPRASKGLPEQREKRKGQMNEFSQTNLDKGLADSAPEAPADYALRYKAGIPPPRAKSVKRVSEYQLQYKWRDAVPSAPILAAEQIIYNSNPQVGPYKPDKIPKRSEYMAQFQAWEPKVQQVQPADNGEKGSPAKKQKLQRSKSAETLSPAQRPAAGVEPVTKPDDKRLIKSSVNPQKLHFPHGKIKKSLSEYKSNFVGPAHFPYENGVWKGADPPHIQTRKDEQLGPVSASTMSSWFSEVMELRQKAAEYKRRAQGTHFSKEHLAQLFAQQNQLWDTVSSRSNLSALSLERPQARLNSKMVKSSGSSEGAEASGDEPGAREAWADDEFDDDTISAPVSSPPCSVNSEQTASSVGRIPTPVLRHSSSKRHHLDRTTPVVGGTLLSSPPRSKVKDKKISSPKTDSCQEDMRMTSKPQESASAPAILPSQKTSPTFGMPTQDTHVLVDDEASQDRPMATQFVHTPIKERGRPAGVLSTIPEGSRTFEETIPHAWEGQYEDVAKVKIMRNKETDALSTSARSLASSASLASEVYERARKHRDQFWGNK